MLKGAAQGCLGNGEITAASSLQSVDRPGKLGDSRDHIVPTVVEPMVPATTIVGTTVLIWSACAACCLVFYVCYGSHLSCTCHGAQNLLYYATTTSLGTSSTYLAVRLLCAKTHRQSAVVLWTLCVVLQAAAVLCTANSRVRRRAPTCT